MWIVTAVRAPALWLEDASRAQEMWIWKAESKAENRAGQFAKSGMAEARIGVEVAEVVGEGRRLVREQMGSDGQQEGYVDAEHYMIAANGDGMGQASGVKRWRRRMTTRRRSKDEAREGPAACGRSRHGMGGWI